MECLVKSHIDEVLSDVGNLGIILDTGYRDNYFFLKFQMSRVNYNRLRTRSNNDTITRIRESEVGLETNE